jgi:PAS domain S-box-containing protein
MTDRPTPIRVLILDDNPGKAEGLIRELRRTHFDPHWKRVATEQDYLAQLDPALDLILSDYSLTGLPGLRALRLLRERGLNIPFLLISARTGEEIAVAAMQAGAADFLLTERLDGLGPAVRRVLEKRFLNERGQIDRQLHRTEKQLADILEHAAESILAVNQDHRIIVFNKAAEKMFGYSAREALGQPLDLLIPDRLVKGHGEHVRNFAASPDRARPMEHRQELVAKRKDGSEFPVEIGLSKLEAEDGIIFTALIVDVTQRKRAEQAVQRMQDRFQALTENAPDGIALIDRDRRLKFVSPAARKIFGYSRDENLDMDPAEHTHPDDLPMVLWALSELIQNPTQNSTLQYRFRHKDGAWIWIESTFTNLLTVPHVEAIVINFRDVTERKQSEKKISQQLERLTALREIDQFIISTFDLRMSLDALLARARNILAIDAASVWLLDPVRTTLEVTAGTGFHTNAIKSVRLRLGQSLAGRVALERRILQIPTLLSQPDDFLLTGLLEEEKVVSYYGAPLIVKGRILGVLEVYNRSLAVRDLDWLDFFSTLAGQAAIAIDNAQLFEHLQRSKIELQYRVAERTEELNRTNAELEQANRAKDEFLAHMSHELRTPLNSILGMSESLLEQRRGPLNESQQASLQIIESGGRHLLELINDILDLSKIEAGMLDYYPQPIRVDEVCRSSLGFVRSQALKKAITLIYNNEGAVSSISADPRRLKQILVNLLTNAVKFTPEHGEVTLQVRTESEQRLIQFSVIDTGIGITPDDLARLFTPFVQVDSSLNRQYEGTGLGLALVQKLTDMHGGSVQVESEVGVGSRFTINLSWGEDIANRQGIIKPDGGMLASGTEEVETSTIPSEKLLDRRVVLLAEDHLANTLTIAEYMESHGYTVVNAHDGLEGIQMAEETNPDIILMDIQMPVMDGLEAIRRLRANPRFARTPIIALTALAMSGDRERCLEAGADEYMSKPVSLKTLLNHIIELMGRKK